VSTASGSRTYATFSLIHDAKKPVKIGLMNIVNITHINLKE
jgi:hypothetical protein